MASKSASSSTIRRTSTPAAGSIDRVRDRGDLEVLALVHEARRLVQSARRRALVADLEHDLVAAAQPPLGDRGGEQRAPDAPAAERVAHEQVADPALEGGVVQAASEAEADEPGRLVVGNRQERRGVGVVDERLVRRPVRAPGRCRAAVELAGQCERIGEVLAAERSKLDAGRARDGQAADRAIRVAERHALSRLHDGEAAAPWAVGARLDAVPLRAPRTSPRRAASRSSPRHHASTVMRADVHGSRADRRVVRVDVRSPDGVGPARRRRAGSRSVNSSPASLRCSAAFSCHGSAAGALATGTVVGVGSAGGRGRRRCRRRREAPRGQRSKGAGGDGLSCRDLSPPRQRPLNSGVRFSRNAAIPSF